MSLYTDDWRVWPHADGLSATVLVGDDTVTVEALRQPGSMLNCPSNLFGGFDADGGRLDVPEGDFDTVVHAIIGDPQ